MLSNLLLLFLAAMILANMGGNMYGPIMPLYLKDLNANVGQIGLFFTLSQIIPLILQILGGYISDMLGRLRAIAIGSVVGIFVFVPMILANTWEWLLLGQALSAITGSLVGPSFDAFIAEHSSEENRARVFGITQSIFLVVSVVGPPLGGWLAGVYGFKFMLLVAAVLYVLATIIRVGMAREATRGEQAHPRKLSMESLKTNLGSMLGLVTAGGVITWVLITDGVRDASFALSMDLFPLYMGDIGKLSLQQIGFMNGIFGLLMMLTTIPAGWLADKKGEHVGIAFGFALIGLSLFLLVSIPAGNVVMYIVGWSLAGMGVGALTPAYQSLISKAVPQHLRGTAFGLFSTSLGVVSLPAPWIGAQLWENVSPQFPFGITACVALLSIVPAWLKFRLPKTEMVAAQA